MNQLSQVEINAIREVVTSHQTIASKLSEYASSCTDANIKQAFQKASQDANKSAQTLIGML
ncbi:MAG: hypothetical protein FWD82_07205 [Defluviitaleaceae bacterium]|nr:hypothetical protein [Defluviitaleaceae bacterium]